MKRYEELYNRVEDDRKENGANFDKEYLEEIQKAVGGARRERVAATDFAKAKEMDVPDDMSASGDEGGGQRRYKRKRHEIDSDDEEDEEDSGLPVAV